MEIYLGRHPEFGKEENIIKRQILDVFEEPFRFSKLKMLESSSKFGQKLSEAGTILGYPQNQIAQQTYTSFTQKRSEGKIAPLIRGDSIS